MTASDRPPQGPPRRKWIVAFGIVLLLLLIVLAAGNFWVGRRLLASRRQESRERAFWVLCQPGYSADTRKQAFELLLAQGNKEWRSALLTDLDLEKGGFVGAQLEAAAFRRARLA